MFRTMRIHHIDADGEPADVVEVHGRKADLIKFERKFNQPAAELFAEEDSIGNFTEPMWFFGWVAEKRANPGLPEFDDWIDTVDQVEIVPTEPVPPTDPDGAPSA